jgi:formylglycine-generating enzyme required for sulfatase activity
VAKTGRENKPVVYVSFYDAMRFCNWLHSGAVTGVDE